METTIRTDNLDLGWNPTGEPIGLYLHVPFCKTRCPYCDFNTYARIEALIPGFTDALCDAQRLWGRALGSPRVGTVFFGGGTPSYVGAGNIARVLDASRQAFQVDPKAEVSLEANPGDLDAGALAALRRAGATRLSIGVQSLDDRLLRLLGRRHTAEQAMVAAREALAAGFPHGVNLDLMFGLPEQSLDDWRRSLDGVLSLRPQHLSLYCLTLEKGTPMEAWVRGGRLLEPDPDLAADMYEHAERALADAGYHHYEISNWAQPGFECRHNLVYWRDRPYLGVGPGAHSRLGDARFSEIKAPRKYIARVGTWGATSPPGPLSVNGEGEPPHPGPLPQGERGKGDGVVALLSRVPTVEGVEVRDREAAMSEMSFLGLRLLDGLDLAEFQRRHGISFLDRYAAEVAELESLGLLERTDGRVRLTNHAHFLSNQVFVRFMP